MDYITKKTKKIRYKLASLIIKHLTPAFYKKIDISTFANRKYVIFTTDNIPSALRPSFRFMKKRFDGISIKGAELGVERGRNAKSILKELNIEKLYLIDAWNNYIGIDNEWLNIDENYKYVLRKFRNDKRVSIIKDYSEHAVNYIEKDSLDFVYIDANHSYKYVYKDIELSFTRVKKGGIIAGHDIFDKHGDVLNAVKDYCFKNKIYFYVEPPDWYFVK